MKNYDEAGVAKQLNKVNGVKVVVSNKTVIVQEDTSIDNGTSGKISFLVNYCGYKKIIGKVNEKTKPAKIVVPVITDDYDSSGKVEKMLKKIKVNLPNE